MKKSILLILMVAVMLCCCSLFLSSCDYPEYHYFGVVSFNEQANCLVVLLPDTITVAAIPEANTVYSLAGAASGKIESGDVIDICYMKEKPTIREIYPSMLSKAWHIHIIKKGYSLELKDEEWHLTAAVGNFCSDKERVFSEGEDIILYYGVRDNVKDTKKELSARVVAYEKQQGVITLAFAKQTNATELLTYEFTLAD